MLEKVKKHEKNSGCGREGDRREFSLEHTELPLRVVTRMTPPSEIGSMLQQSYTPFMSSFQQCGNVQASVKRLCFITLLGSNPWGGSEWLWSKTAQLALADGNEVAVVKYKFNVVPDQITQLLKCGAKFYVHSRPRTSIGKVRARFIYPFPQIKKWAPDHVIVSQGGTYEAPLNWSTRNFLRHLPCPYSIICHHNADERIPGAIERQHAIECYSNAKNMLFVSEHNLNACNRQLAYTLGNAKVIRNPISVECKEIPWNNQTTVNFACVARLDARIKGQEILLNALSFPEWKDRDWKLTFYGKGPDSDYLKTLAIRYEISEKVAFAGHVHDVQEIWAASHVSVLSSRSEGIPISLVEAMVCGRPSVVSDVGGNSEWITEPHSGYVAEAATVKSFNAALNRAWSDRVNWQRVGRNAHLRAMSLIDCNPARTLLELLSG